MELKEELKTEMDISSSNDNRTVLEETQEKAMHCTSNLEDHSFDVEDSADDHHGNPLIDEKGLELDIVECEDACDHGLEEVYEECKDGTDEYSSSFGGTVSETEDGSALSDHEVDSPIHANTSSSAFDGFGGIPRVRKKRLTDHWRRFIRPIMWRCKWLELQINEFQSQARKYDKELEEYNQTKQFALEKLKAEELGTKSLPLPCQTKRKRVMKRKKRKRVEETTDVSSYMSNHNIFSYYEYRKSFADGTLCNDIHHNLDNKIKMVKDEIVFNEGSPSLDFKEGDEHLERILLKIEAAKSEARKLKNRVDKVLSEFPRKFSSVNRLSLLGTGDSLTNSDKKPSSLLETEDEKPVKSVCTPSHLNNIHQGETECVLMSENAVSNEEEEKPVPDKTVQNMEQTSVASSSRNAKKRTIRHRAIRGEITQRVRVSKEKPKSNSPATSRFKIPKRKRNWGKQGPCSVGLRRKS